MAQPLKSGKSSVNLASGEVRVSRIRRDPPPKVKEKDIDPKEIERRDTIVGVIVFALCVFVIIVSIGAYKGWSPGQYRVEWSSAE